MIAAVKWYAGAEVMAVCTPIFVLSPFWAKAIPCAKQHRTLNPALPQPKATRPAAGFSRDWWPEGLALAAHAKVKQHKRRALTHIYIFRSAPQVTAVTSAACYYYQYRFPFLCCVPVYLPLALLEVWFIVLLVPLVLLNTRACEFVHSCRPLDMPNPSQHTWG